MTTMIHVNLENYFMGRDRTYSLDLTMDVRRESARTVDLTNKLLNVAQAAGVELIRRADSNTLVNSGWRPAALNAQTQGAAPHSKHITGQAIDLFDPEGEIDEWLLTKLGQEALVSIGLWMEHPGSTKGWSHLQTIPPRSLNRVFYP